MQRSVHRANGIIKVFIAHICLLGMTILFCLGTGTAALENSLADPGCFAGAVRHHGFVFGIVFAPFIVQGIKRYAVVDISRDDMNIQHKIVLVTGGMRFVSKAFFGICRFPGQWWIPPFPSPAAFCRCHQKMAF